MRVVLLGRKPGRRSNRGTVRVPTLRQGTSGRLGHQAARIAGAPWGAGGGIEPPEAADLYALAYHRAAGRGRPRLGLRIAQTHAPTRADCPPQWPVLIGARCGVLYTASTVERSARIVTEQAR